MSSLVKLATQSTSQSSKLTPSSLSKHGIKYVRVQWLDTAGTLRLKLLPLVQFLKLIDANKEKEKDKDTHFPAGVTVPTAGLGVIFVTLAEGFKPIGEYLYAFDLSSLKLCGYAARHASVLGFFLKQDVTGPVPRYLEVPICPRTTLARVLKTVTDKYPIQFLVGFETEVILLKSTTPVEGANRYGWHEANALSNDPKAAKTIEEIADALEASDVELLSFHSEAAPGQYEFSTGPLPPMEAADALITTRETIYTIAAKNGFKATFAPRLHMESSGSASHTHISLRTTDPKHPLSKPSTPATTALPSLKILEASFLQSLLNHLPSLIVLTMPLKASFTRMTDHVWSGGTHVVWGVDNREVPLRATGRPGNYHFEVRCIDGTSNPHVAVAGMIAAGYLGIESGLALTDAPYQSIVADLTEDEKKTKGIKKLPLSIEEAREALKKDTALVKVLGEEFVTAYLALNKTVEDEMNTGTDEENITTLVDLY